MTPVINPFEHDRLAGRMDRPEVALADSWFITVDVSDEGLIGMQNGASALIYEKMKLLSPI